MLSDRRRTQYPTRYKTQNKLVEKKGKEGKSKTKFLPIPGAILHCQIYKQYIDKIISSFKNEILRQPYTLIGILNKLTT